MTDTTDIAALRPSERTKLGFVTEDNTGGYYVAECEECGKIFPSQTCDGGEQIADTGDYGDCYCPHCGHADPQECDNANLVWNVQQLRIINLTKQLESERQRADNAQADMQFECDAHIETAESWREWKLRAITAAEEIAALKAKLANPVVLPELCSVVEGEYADSPQITPDPDGYLFYSHKVIESIIIAGFTVKE